MSMFRDIGHCISCSLIKSLKMELFHTGGSSVLVGAGPGVTDDHDISDKPARLHHFAPGYLPIIVHHRL